MKYIFDTDPGIDDAIAIVLGYKNKLDIIGFTLASGNIPVEKSENNLKVIQDFLGSNIKMYKGTIENKCNYKTAEYAHGKDGLGYAVFPKETVRKFQKIKAEDFLIKASKKYKDNLTVVCLGPLTNLANAIKKDPKIVNRLKHVVVMGTTYDKGHNEDYVEFNVSVDPAAANLVFSSNFSDIKVITHEIGVKSYIEEDYVNNLKESDNKISRFVGLISEKYIEFTKEHYGNNGLGTPDPITIASLIDDKIINYEPCIIKITNDAKCIVKIVDKSNIAISTDFDLERFRALFKNTFN